MSRVHIHLQPEPTAKIPEEKDYDGTYRPDLSIMPVNHRMHPHELGPVLIRRVKVRQAGPVRVRPPGADEDGPQPGALLQVLVQRRAHGEAVPAQLEVVRRDGVLDEGVDLGEGLRGDYVYGLEGGREGLRRAGADGGGGRGRVGGDLGG